MTAASPRIRFAPARPLRWMVLAAVALAACSTGDGRTLTPPEFPPPQPVVPETTLPIEPIEPIEPAGAPPLQLIAPWPDGSEIPARNTCDGDDLAPALSWTNVPPDAVELVITVVDLDADGFVHWILAGIDPLRSGLTENEQPPPGYEWVNSFDLPGWNGPCPPPNGAHLYQFTIHALNQPLEVADDAPATEVISTLNLIAIDQGAVAGTYTRTE